jgi:glycosyltransferase involved in cell wall biosynthesis
MKIAIVLPAKYKFCVESPNSIETVVRVFASRQLSSDQLVVVCEPGAQKRCNIPVIEVDSRRGHINRNSDIIAALKAFDPEYIEFHQAAAELRPIAKAFPNKATAFYRHNYFKRPKGLFGAWRLYQRMKYFRAVILVSEALRADFLQQFPKYTGLTYAVPNAINPMEWPGDVADKDRVIIYSGRAAPEKGVAPLIKALGNVLPRYPDWRAVLLLNAYSKHEAWITPLLTELAPLGKQVTILKDQRLDVVKTHIRRAAIAVIPSIWKEPFGLTALEAHSAGCAVVSSGTGGLAEVSGGHAIMLPHVDETAISDALIQLIEHPQTVLDLARAGQTFCLETHTTDIRAVQLRNVRQDIVSRIAPDLASA